ncbi:PKD-like family lipoprotein, partial [Faecalibacterium prausnitzii]|uniref:PKD-like family lipoprotein n=2 Tax=Bacteria TaxID=2 RepID=UPI00210ED773
MAWGFTGCYEDKGDYDYRELAHATIGNVKAQYGASVGDTVIIKPEITFDIETKVGLKYEWSVELDSVFSREK